MRWPFNVYLAALRQLQSQRPASKFCGATGYHCTVRHNPLQSAVSYFRPRYCALRGSATDFKTGCDTKTQTHFIQPHHQAVKICTVQERALTLFTMHRISCPPGPCSMQISRKMSKQCQSITMNVSHVSSLWNMLTGHLSVAESDTLIVRWLHCSSFRLLGMPGLACNAALNITKNLHKNLKAAVRTHCQRAVKHQHGLGHVFNKHQASTALLGKHAQAMV